MTISSTTRKAGPFTGTGVQTLFPFTFKVFAAADLLVVQAVTATGLETTKVLTSDYTVALNADQNASPGGSLTMLVAPPAGTTLTLTSQVANTQTTDLTNGGGFYPKVITDALDRLTILSQQLAEKISRALLVTISSGSDPAALIASLFAASATASAQASSASSSATAASTSAAAASASQTAAAGSAATATTQATTATTQAGIATTQTGLTTTQANNAATSAGTATAQAGIATTQATNAAASATAASGSATTASTQAGNAATSATNAATSATNAAGSATSAAANAAITTAAIAVPQNSQSAAYTLVVGDAGKHLFHPAADTTARTWTIPANASVAFVIGTAITFINQNGGGAITIAITTDTLRLAPAGTVGSRTLAANGMASAVKVTATEWLISGVGLT